MSRVKHLQQRLYDLRERERLAKLQNRELLRQFDEAQNTLRELVERTTSMRMLRKEYESYTGSCSHLDQQLNHKTEKIFGERLFGKQNLKANYHLLHSQDCEKMLTKIGVPPELKTQNQKPHHLPSRPIQEHPFTDYPGPDCFLSHTTPPNEPYTDKLNPLTAQTDTVPKQPPILSETSGEDKSHPEDLDVKPVRLSVNQAGSQTSSRASSQGSTQNRKSHSSDEDWFSSHRPLPSREVTTGSKAMVFISETDDTESFNNQKSKHNGLGFKDTKKQEDSSVSESKDDKSDVDECSDKLSELAPEEPQRNSRLKKILTIKEKEQSLSDHSSAQDEDDSDQTDGDRKETSQRDGEMSNQDITRCSSVEGDHITGSNPSSSDSSEESVSSDGGEDNIKVCKYKQDNPHGLEDSDSEDFIVSPQSRSKIIHVIPEHVVKHEDSNSKKTSSDEDSDDSSDEDDIEHVLAPPEQTQNREPKADDKAKEPCHSLERLSVKDGQTDHHSNSYESDDFYD